MNRCFYTVIWKCEKDNLASITLEFQIFFISTVPKSMVALLSVYDTMYCVKYYEIPPFFKRQKNPSIDLLNLFWHVTTDKRAHQCSHYTPPIHQYTSKISAIALDMKHFNIFSSISAVMDHHQLCQLADSKRMDMRDGGAIIPAASHRLCIWRKAATDFFRSLLAGSGHSGIWSYSGTL